MIRADFRKNIFFRNSLEGGLRKRECLSGGGNTISRHRNRKTKAFVIKIETELTFYTIPGKLSGLDPMGQAVG